jgi:pyrroline-5-carboxylate reductase
MSEPTHKEGWLMEIGPYGLGRMGTNMVQRLLRSGEEPSFER